MPKLLSGVAGLSTITALSNATRYRLIGLEISTISSITLMYSIITLGDGSESSISMQPSDIIIDRCWIHGQPTGYFRRGVLFNGPRQAVINSYINDFHDNSDAQAILGCHGPGPYKIVNNYLEATGENIMFGGCDPSIDGVVPSDIEIRRNYFVKNLSWLTADPTWTIKNLYESKNSMRTLIEGNIFEHCWPDGQTGYAFILKSTNQGGSCTWCTTQHMTIRYNKISRIAAVINIAAHPEQYPVISAAHFLIEQCVFDYINISPFDGNGVNIILLGNLTDVTIRHITSVFSMNGDGTQNGQSALLLSTGSEVISELIFQDNMLMAGYWKFGISSAEGRGTGTVALDAHCSSYNVTHNVIVGVGSQNTHPPGNWLPSTVDMVGFVNYNNGTDGNYRLQSSSSYHLAATDGTDVGANIDAIEQATAGCKTGIWSTPPPPSSTSTTTPTPSSTTTTTPTPSSPSTTTTPTPSSVTPSTTSTTSSPPRFSDTSTLIVYSSLLQLAFSIILTTFLTTFIST